MLRSFNRSAISANDQWVTSGTQRTMQIGRRRLMPAATVLLVGKWTESVFQLALV